MKAILANPDLCDRLLGVTPDQFRAVLGRFARLVESAHGDKTVRGRERLRIRTAGSRGGFNDAAAMLAFVLFYYRWYPMQAALGKIFGLTQQWASNWIRHLSPLAAEALGRKLAAPDRRPSSLDVLLQQEPEVMLLADTPLAPRRKKTAARFKDALQSAGL